MRVFQHGLGAATLRAASSPIETLVFCVAITFIAYLYLLHDIQSSHQSFAEPLIRLQPSRLILQDNQRVLHQATDDLQPALFLKQVIVQDARETPNVIEPGLLKAVSRLTNHVTEELYVSDGIEKFYYKDLCFKVGSGADAECFLATPFHHPVLAESEPFKKTARSIARQHKVVQHAPSKESPNAALVAGIAPSALFKDAVVSDDEDRIFDSASMTILSFMLDVSTPEKAMLSKTFADKINAVRLHLLSNLGLVHSTSPNAYAASMSELMSMVDDSKSPHLLDSLARRIQDIATFITTEDQFEVLLVLSSFIMMYATFMYLFMTMNKLGSRFILGIIVILNGTMAFLTALAITRLMGIQLSLRTLSEALPLLVIVVGFEKPCQLTKSVLLASVSDGRETPVHALDDRIRRGHVSSIAKRKVLTGVNTAGPMILKQVSLEMGVLMIGALSRIEGLWEFCTLSMLILAIDCLFLFTFYMSALALKLEILRVRSELSRSPAERNLAGELAQDIKMMTFRALGDSMASEPISSKISMIKERRKYLAEIDRSIVARLRIIVLMGFFAFHLFSLWASPTQSPGIQKLAATKLERVDTYVDSVERIAASVLPALAEARTAIEIGVPSFVFSLQKGNQGGDESHGMSLLKSGLNLCVYLTLIISGVINMYFILIQKLVTEEDARTGRSERAESIAGDRSPVLMATHCSDGMAMPTLAQRGLKSMAMIDRRRSEATRMTEARMMTNLDSHLELSRSYSSTTIASLKSEAHLAAAAASPAPKPVMSVPDLTKLNKTEWHKLTDNELVELVRTGKLPGHSLEKALKMEYERAIGIRRRVVALDLNRPVETTGLFEGLPVSNYNYAKVHGQCCENVIGHMPLPLGLAGPYKIDGTKRYIPMATTEGCLIASTSRGCKAITQSGGATTHLLNDGMTRGPVVEFDEIEEAYLFSQWSQSDDGFQQIKSWFDSTSRFARLQSLKLAVSGRMVFLRFRATTGDAMGMNMISKGVEKVLTELASGVFRSMRVVSISGNYCIDKKPSAINWTEGRGKSVVASCTISGSVVEKTLKTSVAALVEVNTKKNLVGSAMAGSIGGCNAHAANIVTAMYIALGQDVAQNVESSMCLTWMEEVNNGQDLFMSCSMPAIEVGTVGGGTGLPAQASMLELLGIRGANPDIPGENAQGLARIVCASVLAGELSLLSALAAGHLVKSHMQHNRAPKSTTVR